MRKRIPLLYLFLCFTYVVSFAQTRHWLPIEEASYNDISFSLQILHQPTLADFNWIRLVIDNQTEAQPEIISCSFEMHLRAFNNNHQLQTEGMFNSNTPSDFFDNLEASLFEKERLKQGKNSISNHPSIHGAAILGMPEKAFYTVEANVYFSFELAGDSPLNFSWDGIQINFDWFAPQAPQINLLKDKLSALIQRPQLVNYQYHQLHTLLSVEAITDDLKVSEVLQALQKYAQNIDGKRALLHFLDKNHVEQEALKIHYAQLLQAKKTETLYDLLEMPNLWGVGYGKYFLAWLESADFGVKIRIFEVLFLRQQYWKKDKEFCQQLSNHLLSNYGEILYALPNDLSTETFQLWASLATALGKTGDITAIGVLCPFLEDQTNLRSRNLVLYSSSMDPPRPTRACDIALEAILHLQGKNLDLTYLKAGFEPPYIHGEAEIVIDRTRDILIRELVQSEACRF